MNRCFQLIFFLSWPFLTPWAQNAPVSSIGNTFSNDTTVTIPVTVVHFQNIASGAVEIQYDASIANASAVQLGATVPGAVAVNISMPGRIIASWYTWPAIDLPDSAVFLNITLQKITSGTTPLVFNDEENGCFYAGSDFVSRNDLPAGDYYHPGSVTFGATGTGDQSDQVLPRLIPNPCHGNTSLCFTSEAGGPATLVVLDISGNLILHKRIFCKAGNVILPLETGMFEKGFYIVRLVEKAKASDMKLVVQ